jgi:ribonuclease E
MPKRMLIDASHPEETRVVVLDGSKVEEFDFESATKLPLKGNIYLAKVTRVEPSLQAAFVEYGGNRQGFLAFSEIHPDYYQIPVADRLALLADAEAEAKKRAEDDFESFDISPSKKRRAGAAKAEFDEDAEDEEGDDKTGTETAQPADAGDEGDENDTFDETPEDGAAWSGSEPAPEEEGSFSDDPANREDSGVEFGIGGETAPPPQAAPADSASAEGEAAAPEGAAPEGGENQPQENSAAQTLQATRPSQRWMRKRHYKIQEVIKRRQIILVQVVKEERGNKGAALTTYLSLAGRYCVLMPNTPRGGGISRKITNAADRKRLKAAAQSLELPEGMGLIIRTAGANRTKLEIKRDYEYLLRMWDTIRDMTLKSTAPACVYEEGDLVKRAIRDLYNKDVAEVLVEGDEGYRSAKDFMRMLMPSHAKNVKPYKEPVPLFQRFHIEAQLDSMFSPTVTLKSGGYIVINQTEALVAIDVNSGRATKEHSIEETATKTNLEAADEIGRQLRLRDLAGLIVIDFIDMEDGRNDRAVEKRLMNAVKNDRARIQVGKISQFGLLELSRQRLRAGVVAGSTITCPHCAGTGLVRSVESTSLRVLRGIEEEAQKQRAESLNVHVAGDVAIYIFNQKRAELARIESEYAITIAFEPTETLKAGDFEIDRIGVREPDARVRPAVTVDTVIAEPEEEPQVEDEAADEETAESPEEPRGAESGQQQSPQQPPQGEGRRRRRRRGGRGRHEHDERREPSERPPQPQQEASDGAEAPIPGEAGEAAAPQEEISPAPNDGEQQNGEQRRKRRRRRGRRGGRDRNRDNHGETEVSTATDEQQVVQPSAAPQIVQPAFAPPVDVFEDRFGRIDEIDTTPRDVSRVSTAAPDVPVSPNTDSRPDWSLAPGPETAMRHKVDIRQPEPPAPVPVAAPEPPPATAPKHAPAHRPVPAPKPAPAPAEPASQSIRPEEPAGEAAPDQPLKKGWWQRTFNN